MSPHADDAVVDPGNSTKTKELPINGHVKAKTAPNGDTTKPTTVSSNGESKETLEPTHHASPNPPLQLKGVLNDYKSFDVTPVIGREFPEAKLAEWLRAPNSDELIKDLAITSSILSLCESSLLTDSYPSSLPTWCRLFPRSRWLR